MREAYLVMTVGTGERGGSLPHSCLRDQPWTQSFSPLLCCYKCELSCYYWNASINSLTWGWGTQGILLPRVRWSECHQLQSRFIKKLIQARNIILVCVSSSSGPMAKCPERKEPQHRTVSSAFSSHESCSKWLSAPWATAWQGSSLYIIFWDLVFK